LRTYRIGKDTLYSAERRRIRAVLDIFFTSHLLNYLDVTRLRGGYAGFSDILAVPCFLGGNIQRPRGTFLAREWG